MPRPMTERGTTTTELPCPESVDDQTLPMIAPLEPGHANDTKPHTGSALALLAGVMAIGFAPIFAKFAMNEGMGPSAAAFWRVTLALPMMSALWIWSAKRTPVQSNASDNNTKNPQARSKWRHLWLFVPGILFAGDLAVWHTSIFYTSAAMATLLGNCQVVLVSLFGWLVLREKMRWMFPVGAGLALTGVAMLLFVTNQPIVAGRNPLLGNVLGLITAAFYASYILSLQYLRRSYSTATVIWMTGAVSAIGLLIISLALGERFVVNTPIAWWSVVGLAVVPHFIGQGLITFAQAKLTAGFTSVTLLLQPLCVAVWGWLLLNESLTSFQIVAGTIVLIGIFLARRGTLPRR